MFYHILHYSMLLEAIISIAIGVLGLVFGMDRRNNITDAIGPLIMLGGIGYALWHGLWLIGGFMFLFFIIKLFMR